MKLISGASSGRVKAIDTKSSSFLSAIEEDRKRKEAQAKRLQRDAVIADSNAKAEKYYQESTGGVLNTINRFLDPIIGGTKAVGATAKDVLTPWNSTVTPSVTYQGVEYKTPGQKGVEGGQKIAQGQIKQGIGQVGEGILDVAQFIPVGGAVVRGATKAVPIMQGLKNLGSLQGIKTAGVNLLKNKSVQQNAALMGGYGATGAMQENQGAGGIALETAKGVGIGAGAGLAFEGAGSLIGRAFTNLFEKIGTRPRVQVDETVARETVDEITDIQGKPPTPEEEDAILEAFANGATKEEIVTEVGKAKVADGFEVKPKLAEVVDQLEANGEKLSLDETMTVKTALDEGKSFEEIQTSLRTPELAVKSTPEPRKVESDTNTPDNGDDAFLKSVETRFNESKTNKFREATKDEKGRFTGSRKGITGDAEKDSLAESIQNQIDNTKDDDILRYDLQAIQDKIPDAKTSELSALKAERDALIQERIDNRAKDVRPQVTKERKEIYKQELAKDSSSLMEFQVGLKRNGISPMKEFKTRDDMIAYFEKNRGTSKYRKETLAQSFERVSKQKITPEQEAKIIALNKKLFGDEDVKITAQLLTPEGQKAFGVYKNKVIKILDGQADPTDTYYHEAVHKYLDLFTTLDEQKKIYVEARKVWKTDNLDELEEKIAENFIRYAKNNEGVVGTMKVMFDKVIDRIKVALGKESEIEALYKDILEGKATKPKETVKVSDKPEPKKKTSVIASRLNEALPEGFKIDESYDPKVIKEELDKASQGIFKDKEAAIKKAFDPNTNPVERDAILIELSEIAKRDGDFDAVADLFQRRAELIRSGAQSLNMEKASILLNPQEKYMRDIVNSRLGSVKVNGKDLTEVEVSAIRKTVRRETSEVTKKAFKIQDAQSLLNSITCT